MELTKDTYEYLLNFADDRTLLNMLSVNKKFAQKLEDDDFFKRLLEIRYPYLLEFKDKDESFKNFYLREIYYIAIIEEKYKIPYYSVKGYDPEYMYYYFKRYYIKENNKNEILRDILDLAISANNFDVIEKITKEYKDLNLYETLRTAIKRDRLYVIKYLIETFPFLAIDIHKAIDFAMFYEQYEILEYLRTKLTKNQ